MLAVVRDRRAMTTKPNKLRSTSSEDDAGVSVVRSNALVLLVKALAKQAAQETISDTNIERSTGKGPSNDEQKT